MTNYFGLELRAAVGRRHSRAPFFIAVLSDPAYGRKRQQYSAAANVHAAAGEGGDTLGEKLMFGGLDALMECVGSVVVKHGNGLLAHTGA